MRIRASTLSEKNANFNHTLAAGISLADCMSAIGGGARCCELLRPRKRDGNGAEEMGIDVNSPPFHRIPCPVLVFGRFLDMVNDENLNRAFPRLQRQAKLLLDRREDRRPGISSGRVRSLAF